jgi:D-alanyl-D-alanine carboxypeptidase
MRLAWPIFLFVLLCASCRQFAISQPVTPTTSITPDEIDPYPVATSSQIQALTPTEVVEIEPSPLVPTATRSAAGSLHSPGPNLIPCGILLPFPAAGLPEKRSPLDIEIPQGLVPDAALPAVNRLIAAPGTVGLAAFQLGREEDGVYLNADQPMPLASVVKVVNLIAYANAAAAGELDTAEWIPIAELERSYLPGMDLGAHRRAIEELRTRGLIARDPPATPLEEVPLMMIRYSSNAAADYLHLLLGQERIEKTAIDLGLENQTAICPWIGQFLVIQNHERTGSDRAAVQSFIDNPEAYGQEVMRLTEAFTTNPDFREAESIPGIRRRTIDVQRLFSENLNAQGTAREYGLLMSKILQNQLNTSYTNILVRRVMEWPMAFQENQDLFSTIGFKDGSLPGVLTTAYYAQRLVDGRQVVVALFYRDLPMQTYRDWRDTLPHDEFARWLLSDPDAIPQLRSLLETGES